MTDEDLPDEQKWPGILHAYEFVRASFDWSLQQKEAATDRLQSLLTYSATLTFAAPVVAKAINEDTDYESPFFVTALVLFGLISLAGIVLRSRVQVDLISANKLYDDFSGLSEWDFKKNMLSHAGNIQDRNLQSLNTLADRTTYLSFLFGAEVLLLAIWIVTAF